MPAAAMPSLTLEPAGEEESDAESEDESTEDGGDSAKVGEDLHSQAGQPGEPEQQESATGSEVSGESEEEENGEHEQEEETYGLDEDTALAQQREDVDAQSAQSESDEEEDQEQEQEQEEHEEEQEQDTLQQEQEEGDGGSEPLDTHEATAPKDPELADELRSLESIEADAAAEPEPEGRRQALPEEQENWWPAVGASERLLTALARYTPSTRGSVSSTRSRPPPPPRPSQSGPAVGGAFVVCAFLSAAEAEDEAKRLKRKLELQ